MPAILAAAAVVLACVSLGWLFLRQGYPVPQASGQYEVVGGGDVRPGSVLRVKGQPAALVLGGYARIEIKPNTPLRLEGGRGAEGIFLDSGEVHCEVDRDVGIFAVRTQVRTVSVTGTEFIVQVTEQKEDHKMSDQQMTVRVLVGAVLVSGAWGNVTLSAGEERAFTEDALGAAKAGREKAPLGYRLPEKALFRANFEDGVADRWNGGRIVEGGFEPSKCALQSAAGSGHLEYWGLDLRPTQKTVLQFACRAEEDLPEFQVLCWDDDAKDNTRHAVKGLTPGRWQVVKVRFRDFFFWTKPDKPVDYLLKGLTFVPGGKLSLDDVVIYEESPAPATREDASAPAVAPVPLPEGETGIAAKYPGDAGIERDPAVIFAENFETGSIEDLRKRWQEVSNKDGKVLAFSNDVPSASAAKRSLQMTGTLGENTGGHRVWFDHVVAAKSYVGPLKAR